MHQYVIARSQALAFRQHAMHLHRRLGRGMLAKAAFSGLQDSSPRSAVLALHARVRDVSLSAWEDPQLVQIWGPRGADYVVPKTDMAVFTIGRLPRDPLNRAAVDSAMERVATAMLKRETTKGERHQISLGYARDLRTASITGRLRIRWDGSKIEWWSVDPPEEDTEWSRLELARRFLGSMGPSTPASFAWWSGVTLSDAKTTFRSLGRELSEVNNSGLQSWALRKNRALLEKVSRVDTVRLLPPGDPYLCIADHEMLVPEAYFRAELWPRSVWPGALFVGGDVTGTWRRSKGRVTIRPWRRITEEITEAVDQEVQHMPIESSKKEARWEPPLEPR
jgi:Winged helix DNA-binding domain